MNKNKNIKIKLRFIIDLDAIVPRMDGHISALNDEKKIIILNDFLIVLSVILYLAIDLT